MPSYTTFESRLKNSTAMFCVKCSPTCFTDTFPTIHPKQFPTLIPGNTTILTMPKTRRNVGATWPNKPGCLHFQSFAEHYNCTRGNIFHLLYINSLLRHLQILDCMNMEKASLLVPTELGRGGFESLLEYDSKAQPPVCILWYPLHIARY